MPSYTSPITIGLRPPCNCNSNFQSQLINKKIYQKEVKI